MPLTDRERHILEEVERIRDERGETYGDDMYMNHVSLAEVWSAWLGEPLSASDVLVMLTLNKLNRLSVGDRAHYDSWLDALVYLLSAYDAAMRENHGLTPQETIPFEEDSV